jgi:hypothetical protein
VDYIKIETEQGVTRPTKKSEFGGTLYDARIKILSKPASLEGIFMHIQYETKIKRPLLNSYRA